MNKKILEDVKFNNRSVVKTNEEVLNKDLVAKDNTPNTKSLNSNVVPDTVDYKETPLPNIKKSSKYDFLNKLNKKTSSFPQRISQTPHLPSKVKNINKFLILLFIISIIIGVIYLISTVFFEAKVTIISKNESFDLKSLEIIADKNKSGSVPFEVMIVDDTEIKDVILTTSSEISSKSKGEITLFNEYSTKTQKIISGTYISDEKGKTYKTDKTVSVPGYTKSGTKIIPGKISVGIISFLPGDIYNGSPLSFYINSYKDTKKYTKIYGKILFPLSGGYSGLTYSLDDSEKELYLSNTSGFKDKLIRKLAAQVPPGYILYPDAVNFTYDFNGDSNSKTPNAKLEMKGTLSAVLINEKDLSSIIIDKLLPDITPKEKSEIIQPDLSVLTFKFVSADQVITKDLQNFDFILKGSLPLKWNPDIYTLKNLLVGKNKLDVPNIFKNDPGISSASVKIFPFWSKVLPNTFENINILLK